MTVKKIKFSDTSTVFYFDASFGLLEKLVSKDNAVIITDENIFSKHTALFQGWNIITINPGEQYKIQATVDSIIEQLIESGANRKTFLVGMGGGVVTDIAGYVAGIYMRGVKFGFVPTSVLAMVDAAIGGKNGIDAGVYKNMVGLIRQPDFLLYDYFLLKSLPKEEWVNGFAEIIKHACIKDAAMYKMLQKHSLNDFQNHKGLLAKLIQRNALLKAEIVQKDEFETGDRRLLNFGHTLGHAIENTYALPHGHAVAIGMIAASYMSESLLGFKDADNVASVVVKYGLPAFAKFDVDKALHVMQSDKKRIKDEIHYILLKKIGKSLIRPLTIQDIKPLIQKLSK